MKLVDGPVQVQKDVGHELHALTDFSQIFEIQYSQKTSNYRKRLQKNNKRKTMYFYRIFYGIFLVPQLPKHFCFFTVWYSKLWLLWCFGVTLKHRNVNLSSS